MRSVLLVSLRHFVAWATWTETEIGNPVSHELYGNEERSKFECTLQYKLRYGYVELELHIIDHLHRTFSLLESRIVKSLVLDYHLAPTQADQKYELLNS